MSESATHATLTKAVHVVVPVTRAFELFTARLGELWPLATHSVGEETEVTLRHSGWSSRPDGERARSQYDGGWDLVLSRFTASGAR
jgi:hypothetical protein